MKSILIVTEQFTLGGLETHIRGEIQQLFEQGVTVHLATGNAFDSTFLPPCVSTVTSGISLEPSASAGDLLTAIGQLRAIIREHEIEAVHVHPFTSMIPAVAAAELESVRVAITLHGPASLPSYYGPIYDFLVKDVILANARLIVAVSPEVKNLLSPHAASDAVTYIPNSILFSDVNARPLDQNEIDSRWLLVSRLDSFKIQGILDFCIKAQSCGLSSVLIVGDGPAKADLYQALVTHNLSKFAFLAGARTDVLELMQRSGGVAGMGRVLLEGVAARRPVVLVGYDGVKGVVDTALLNLASEANFSGRGLPTLDAESFSEELRTKLKPEIISDNYYAAKEAFNEISSWRLFNEKLSATARVSPTLITGFCHSLEESPATEDTPYLQSMELMERLAKVVCSRNYYDPRLVSSVSLCRQRVETMQQNQVAVAERDGQIANLNQAVAERDGQIANLNQAVAERDGQIANLTQAVAERNGQIANLNQTVAERDGQIANLNQTVAERDRQIANLSKVVAERNGQIQNAFASVEAIRNSMSWRITGPLRAVKQRVLKLLSPP